MFRPFEEFLICGTNDLEMRFKKVKQNTPKNWGKVTNKMILWRQKFKKNAAHDLAARGDCTLEQRSFLLLIF